MDPTKAQGVVDRTFLRLGFDALYTPPGGQPVNCRIMVHRESKDRRESGLTINAGGHMLGLAERPLDVLVRASEIARPETGGIFAWPRDNPTKQYRVGETPVDEDALGLSWRCPVVTA